MSAGKGSAAAMATSATQRGTSTSARATTTKATTATKKATTAKTTTARTTVTGQTAKNSATGEAARPRKRSTSPAAMPVKADESPWSAKELATLRAEIEAHITSLEEEIATAEAELFDLMHDAGDGAGDDQADAGAKTYEREQEISLANNARDLLEQNRRALERMDDGSYGVCESCGEPIGKLRLQAAPRATLCMPCKMKQERR